MATTKKRAGNDLVRVACKLPQGITIVIPPVGDNREKRIKLHGRYSPYAVADHGMTNISADDWSTIQIVHAEALWLKNEHVFSLPDEESVADKAEERADVNAGFNKIDPKDPANSVAGAGRIQAIDAPDLGPTR